MNKEYNFETSLRSKGLRATAQRLLIMSEISNAGHISIENLYEILKEKIPSISLATVYKNIHSLVEKDIISEVNIEGRKSLYELNISRHIHHICEKCGAVEDIPFDTSKIPEIIPELRSKNINSCRLTTTGICGLCS